MKTHCKTRKFSEEDKENIIERLKYVKKALAMTDEEFADVLGISKSALRDIFNGDSNISIDKLFTLGKDFNVSLDYLVTNKVDYMYLPRYVQRRDIPVNYAVECLIYGLSKVEGKEERAVLLNEIIHRLTEI